MEEFKNIGDPAAALAEECSEVIKEICKVKRFGGNWNFIPPLQKNNEHKTRWELLEAEMNDLLYQWERLKATNPTNI